MNQDKEDLTNYIKNLNLDKEIEEFLVNHVEESAMDEALLNRVASVLELVGESAMIEADFLEETAGILDEYRGTLEDLEDNEKEETEKILNEFLEKVEAAVNENKLDAPQENSPTTPQINP